MQVGVLVDNHLEFVVPSEAAFLKENGYEVFDEAGNNLTLAQIQALSEFGTITFDTHAESPTGSGQGSSARLTSGGYGTEVSPTRKSVVV